MAELVMRSEEMKQPEFRFSSKVKIMTLSNMGLISSSPRALILALGGGPFSEGNFPQALSSPYPSSKPTLSFNHYIVSLSLVRGSSQRLA